MFVRGEKGRQGKGEGRNRNLNRQMSYERVYKLFHMLEQQSFDFFLQNQSAFFIYYFIFFFGKDNDKKKDNLSLRIKKKIT